jgi:hypothetical protein
VGHILYASKQLGKSLAEIGELARPMAAFGISLPNIDAFADNNQPFRDEQLTLLSYQLNGAPPFLDALSVGTLLYAAKQLQKPIVEIVETARSLERFGITIPQLDALLESSLGAEQMIVLLSRDFDGMPPFVDSIKVDHLLLGAEALRKSPAEVAEIVRPLTNLGIDVADLSVLGKKQQRAIALSHNLGSVSGATATDLLDVVKKLQMSRPEITELIRSLVSVGIKFSDFNFIELAQWAQRRELSLKQAIRDLKCILPAFPQAQEWLSRIQISDATGPLLLRTYSRDRGEPYSLSPWDLAGAAQELKVPVSSLKKELNALEALQIDTTDCRAFIQFCVQHEGRLTS